MRIIAISDFHEQQEKLIIPEGDLLVCAGDMTYRGEIMKLRAVNKWFSTLTFGKSRTICCAGNHELTLNNHSKRQLAMEEFYDCTYLENESITIDGVNFYLSPITPWFHDWAFNVFRGEAIQKYWDKIPDDTHVLVTHGPPAGILDKNLEGEHVGCENLRDTIFSRLKQLKLHVFGHIHEGYGQMEINGVKFVNASICNRDYDPVNAPIVIDL